VLSSFHPLRSRNFSLVWSSALVSNVGTWIETVALGTLIATTTHSALWTALVMAAGFLPMGLFAALGGGLGDRFDRRRWLIVTTIAETVVAAVLAFVVALHRDPVSVLVLLSFLGGSAGAIGFPAYQAMLPDLVEKGDLLAAISLSSAQWNMGRVLGPAVAGVILVLWSPAAAFSINALSFFAVIGALCFVRLPFRPRSGTHESVLERLRSGARTAFAEPGCRAAIVLISLVALIGSPFIGLISAMAINGLHQKAGGPAVLTTAQGVGAVLGALCIAPLAKRHGQRVVIVCSLLGLGGALMAYGAAPSLVTAAFAIGLVGATYIGVLSGLNGVVQLRAPEEARGRVLSLFMMALGTIYPLGLILEGALGQAIGIRLLTACTGLVLLVVFGILGIFARGIFRSLRPSEGEKNSEILDLAIPEVAEVDLGVSLRVHEERAT